MTAAEARPEPQHVWRRHLVDARRRVAEMGGGQVAELVRQGWRGMPPPYPWVCDEREWLALHVAGGERLAEIKAARAAEETRWRR